MQREQRLRRAVDFAAVYRRGRSWSNQLLVLKVLPVVSPEATRRRLAAPLATGESKVEGPDGHPASRYGFAVGKRIGKAVVRNRIRRRLREIIRRLPVSPGWDTVVVARGPALDASFEQLQRAVEDVFRRARLIGPSSQPISPA